MAGVLRRRLLGFLVGTVVVGGAAGLAAPPSGTLLRTADFETHDFSQWSGVQAAKPERYSVVASPHRQGSFAGRFESVAGECIPMDCTSVPPRGRTEALLKGPQHTIHEGDDRWYHWYTLFPARGPVPAFVFTQWRGDDERVTPRAPFGLYGLLTVDRSRAHPRGFLAFHRNGVRWTAPLRRGVWIEFLVHIRYSADPALGRYELWVDGKHVASFHDQSKPSNTGVYFKQGVYRLGRSPSAVVYHDGLRIADTRAMADLGRVDRLLGRDDGRRPAR
jgi:Polysaccharide lyase